MAFNTTLATPATPSLTNSSAAPYQVTGWHPSASNRGSIDILWSCCITIVLCCWVSTFPNVPSLNDKWYHSLIDKFNLACLGLVGPDYLFAIAVGQISSARRSVKLFRNLSRDPSAKDWSLIHGFFADMGGFVLESPDCDPFPINAEQLHYLVNNGHVDMPTLSKRNIKTLSKTDSVSKLIVLWQVFWFSISTLLRLKQGLPMTTFELTALTFSLTMLMALLCWYAKPTISSPERIPLLSRPLKARPWDRFPSEAFLVIDRPLLAPALIVAVGFSVSPLAAWNFHFPTEGEKIAWRVCSVYHAAYSISLTVYYIYCVLKEYKRSSGPETDHSRPLPLSPRFQQPGGSVQEETRTGNVLACRDIEAGAASSEQSGVRFRGAFHASIHWLRSWRNISPDGDPDMALGLRATFLPLIGTFLYLFCLIFFYVEDFISIRQQPVDVYKNMNKFLPFMS